MDRCNNSHVDEELNIDATSFFNFWKIMMNRYKMGTQIIANYRPLHKYLSSNQIIGWLKSVMIISSNGQENILS
jgi:hypothetical protein